MPINTLVPYENSITILGMGYGVPPIVLTPNTELVVGRSNSADISVFDQSWRNSDIINGFLYGG